MQKIAFFALHNTVNFHHIGGLDSLTRRLARGLAETGDTVEFVFYGAPTYKAEPISPQISQVFFTVLPEAFEHLKAESDHIISLYLKPLDRPTYGRFRRSQNKLSRFHHIYSVWHESRLKRDLLFAEARIYPFNGCLFCLSPRVHHYVSTWADRSTLLWPPVPDSFFCKPSDKPDPEQLKVTFAGRVDPGKGIVEAVNVFKRLHDTPNIETRVCGYAWSHRSVTMEMHERLLSDPKIRYEPAEYKSWSPEVDSNLFRTLRDTDILLLPYQKLSSTIDTPLLLLEGMANLCAVITPPLGDLHGTYGDSNFNLKGLWNEHAVINIIKNARALLREERERIADQNASLKFNAASVSEQFRQFLNA